MIKTDRLIERLKSLDDSTLIGLWNEYCDDTSNMDDYIEDMDSFDDFYCDAKPIDIAFRIFYGNFNPNHNYFRFNGYGNLVSFDFADSEESPIDYNTLVDWITEGRCENLDDYIDIEDLTDDFIAYCLPNVDWGEAKQKIEAIYEAETFDLITEDWNDLVDTYNAFEGPEEDE